MHDHQRLNDALRQMAGRGEPVPTREEAMELLGMPAAPRQTSPRDIPHMFAVARVSP